MKARFLAFLAAIAVGCTSVLIYASYTSNDTSTTEAVSMDDCDACAHAATASIAAPTPATAAAEDECCMTEAAKPAVATLASPGCPYMATDATVTAAPGVTPAAMAATTN